MVKSCYCMQAKIKHAHSFYLGLYILCLITTYYTSLQNIWCHKIRNTEMIIQQANVTTDKETTWQPTSSVPGIICPTYLFSVNLLLPKKSQLAVPLVHDGMLKELGIRGWDEKVFEIAEAFLLLLVFESLHDHVKLVQVFCKQCRLVVWIGIFVPEISLTLFDFLLSLYLATIRGKVISDILPFQLKWRQEIYSRANFTLAKNLIRHFN